MAAGEAAPLAGRSLRRTAQAVTALRRVRRCASWPPWRLRRLRSIGSSSAPSPLQLDLELSFVALHLELDLELDLVGDVHVEVHAAPLELDVVAAAEHVGEPPETGRDLLSAHGLLLLYLEDVHRFSLPSGVPLTRPELFQATILQRPRRSVIAPMA